jgi:hypothetical protein
VLTQTASVHIAAWKRLFDGFLQQRSASTGEAFIAFDIHADYRRYVDGQTAGTATWPHFSNRAEFNFRGEREEGPGANGVRLGNLDGANPSVMDGELRTVPHGSSPSPAISARNS